MQIILKIPTQELFEKIIWFLNKFRSDGVEVIIDNKSQNRNSKNLDELEKIINAKSKNSKVLDKDSILNPHIELSRDIS
jgi:hypothetical protein